MNASIVSRQGFVAGHEPDELTVATVAPISGAYAEAGFIIMRAERNEGRLFVFRRPEDGLWMALIPASELPSGKSDCVSVREWFVKWLPDLLVRPEYAALTTGRQENTYGIQDQPKS